MKKIAVLFEADEDDEDIFKSALEFGLEQASGKGYAKVISVKIAN